MLPVISFEVETKRAMFARVDSTSSLIQSYPIPTPTAVEGLCNSIVGIHREKKAVMRAISVQLCSHIMTDMEKTNSYTISRKPELVNKGVPQQMIKVFLINQRWVFKVRAETTDISLNGDKAVNKMFEHYIKTGKQLKSPSCGHSEMLPVYIGPIREDTEANIQYTTIIPDFLIRTWNKLIDGEFVPFYAPFAKVEKGYLNYYDLRKENNVL